MIPREAEATLETIAPAKATGLKESSDKDARATPPITTQAIRSIIIIVTTSKCLKRTGQKRKINRNREKLISNFIFNA